MAPRPFAERALGLAAGLSLLLSPAWAQPASAPPPDCAAERAALQAEHATVKSTIGDIALGRTKSRPKVGAGQIGRAAAGAAASLLLPFGIGLAAGAAATAAGAASKKGKKRAPPAAAPDVGALIDRQYALEDRIAALGTCAATPAP